MQVRCKLCHTQLIGNQYRVQDSQINKKIESNSRAICGCSGQAGECYGILSVYIPASILDDREAIWTQDLARCEYSRRAV